VKRLCEILAAAMGWQTEWKFLIIRAAALNAFLPLMRGL
jgi:hypothetical protein